MMYLAKSPLVSTGTIGGIAVIYNEATNEVYELEGSAAKIWNEVNGLRNLREVSDVLIQYYGVDRQTAYDDTVELIEELIVIELIVTSPVPFEGVLVDECG